jgi:hypothetical protein
MRTTLKIILLFSYFFSTNALAQKQPDAQQLKVQQVIRNVFEAFSEGSMEKMKQEVTDDVTILEHGEVWTLDSIKTAFSRPRPADFKRINTLDFFQTEVSSTMAFVSYHNRADVHVNNKDRVIKWLESAVLVKNGKEWKLKMLHSTRLEHK